jgi:PAS domain S-box-containing protein
VTGPSLKSWPFELRAAALYAAISAAWILLSDRVVERLVRDTSELTLLQNYKGWFFVAATTVLTYVVLRRYRQRHEAAQRQLAASERRLVDVVEHAADGIMNTAVAGAILRANPAACRLLGYSEAALRASGRGLVLDPADPRVMEAIRIRQRDGVFHGVLPYRRADGTFFEGETTSQTYVGDDGAQLSIVIFRDITERVVAERQLFESEARYRTLFEGHHVPTLLIDPATAEIVDANPAAARFYGWDLAALRRMRIDQLNVLPTEAIQREMDRAREEERDWFRFVHRTASGEERPVDVYSGPITLSGRRLLFSVVHDQTSLHQVQESLARLNRLYAMLSLTNEALVRVTAREELFQRVCDIAVAEGGFLFAWMGEVQPDASVRFVARAGIDHGYLDAITVSADESVPEGQGPTGQSIRSGKPVVVNDSLDPAVRRPWSALADRAGVRSSASFPIYTRGMVIGALGLYADVPDFFHADALKTVSDMAADVSFGLDRLADAAERDEMTRELERASQRWRFALEGAGHGVWEWDFTTGAVEVSTSLAAMVGYKAGELPRQLDQWMTLIHPDDHPMLAATFERFVSGADATYRAEYRVRSASGAWVWVLSSGIVLDRDEHGSPVRAIGTQVDLTDVKRSEEARQELQTFARKLLEHSTDLVLLLRGTRIVYVNPAGVRMLNAASASAITGCTIYDIFHPHSYPLIDVRLAKLMAEPGSTAPPVRDRIVTRAAVTLDVEASAVSYQDAGETVVQMSIRDLTARLRTERELAETTSRLQLALGASGQGIFDINLETGDVVTSPEYASMLGHDAATFRESVAGWGERLHPDDRERMLRLYGDYIGGLVPEYRAEFRLRTADGGWKWILSLGRIVERSATGAPVRMVGTHTDIDARYRAA